MLLRPIHTFAVASLLLGGISLAQAPAGSPLLPPAGLTYRYWPLSLTQFVGPELPYAAISIYVDDRGSAPLYDVTLTAREGGKRVHYVNKPELAEEDKAVGDDASVVQIGFDKNGDIGKGTQYSVRFNTEKGVPVQWQFEQLTDSSEQGSGVTPLKTPTPYLLYREQGALAGAATALKIGNVTSNATVWKEIAAPPYFVPYQGALSQGVHILRISSTDTQWKGQQPPSANRQLDDDKRYWSAAWREVLCQWCCVCRRGAQNRDDGSRTSRFCRMDDRQNRSGSVGHQG